MSHFTLDTLILINQYAVLPHFIFHRIVFFFFLSNISFCTVLLRKCYTLSQSYTSSLPLAQFFSISKTRKKFAYKVFSLVKLRRLFIIKKKSQISLHLKFDISQKLYFAGTEKNVQSHKLLSVWIRYWKHFWSMCDFLYGLSQKEEIK